MKNCWDCGRDKAHINGNGTYLCSCGHRWWDTDDGNTAYFSFRSGFDIVIVEHGILFVITATEERLPA